MGWVDRKYRERQALLIMVCYGFTLRFAFDAWVHIYSSGWMRNCQNQEYGTWNCGKDVTYQKSQCKFECNLLQLPEICYSYRRSYISICKNIAFVNNQNESQQKKPFGHFQRTLWLWQGKHENWPVSQEIRMYPGPTVRLFDWGNHVILLSLCFFVSRMRNGRWPLIS